MARNLDPKCKQCRRAAEKLFLKGERCFGPKCALTKRNYPPGIHGNKLHPRLTDYGTHLREKQKLSRMYGVLERQLRKYFEEAFKSKNQTGLKLVEFLERRMDSVVYRVGLATSRCQARQLVGHGLFLVNGKKINIPSYRLKTGDIIKLRKEKTVQRGSLAENIKKIEKKKDFPAWLSWDNQKNEIKVLSLPTEKDLEINIDPRLIIEFYSR